MRLAVEGYQRLERAARVRSRGPLGDVGQVLEALSRFGGLTRLYTDRRCRATYFDTAERALLAAGGAVYLAEREDGADALLSVKRRVSCSGWTVVRRERGSRVPERLRGELVHRLADVGLAPTLRFTQTRAKWRHREHGQLTVGLDVVTPEAAAGSFLELTVEWNDELAPGDEPAPDPIGAPAHRDGTARSTTDRAGPVADRGGEDPPAFARLRARLAGVAGFEPVRTTKYEALCGAAGRTAAAAAKGTP